MIAILDRALRDQRYLRCLTVISIAVWLFLGVIWIAGPETSGAISNSPIPFRILVNVLAGVVDVLALPGSIVLWISSIYHLRHFDTSSAVRRGLWFGVLLFGFCFGASIYFWLRMRTTRLTETESVEKGLPKKSLISFLKLFTGASWLACLAIAFLGHPARPVLSHEVLAGLSLAAVLSALLSTSVYGFVLIFAKKTK